MLYSTSLAQVNLTGVSGTSTLLTVPVDRRYLIKSLSLYVASGTSGAFTWIKRRAGTQYLWIRTATLTGPVSEYRDVWAVLNAGDNLQILMSAVSTIAVFVDGYDLAAT